MADPRLAQPPAPRDHAVDARGTPAASSLPLDAWRARAACLRDVGRVSFVVLAVGVFAACGGTASRLRAASSAQCSVVLRDHPSLAQSPDYQAQPDVFAYELRVATCALDSGDPSTAVALASKWELSQNVERAEVIARAAASAGDDARAKDAIEQLAEMRGTRTKVFARAPELLRYAGQEWFVRAALRAWWRDRSEKVRPYVARVAGVRVGELVSLSVASADPGVAPGAWGVWSGIERESRVDRARGVTTLYAEGIDTYELRIDEHVRVTSGAGGQRHVDIEGRAGEKLEPNGRKFVVEVKEVRPALAELRTFIAVGKVASGDADGRPVLDAFVVVDRQPRGGSEMK